MSVHVAWLVNNSRLVTWTGPYLSIPKNLARKGLKTSILGYYNLGMPLSGILTHPSVYDRIDYYVGPTIRNPKARMEFIGGSLGKLEASKLADVLKREKVDFVVTIGYFQGLPSAARRAGAVSVLWSVDDPFTHSPKWFRYSSEFDHVLTYSLGSIPFYKSHGVKAIWFPTCVDTDYYFKAGSYKQDLLFSFIGSCLVDREPGHKRMLYPLVERYGGSVHIFGRGWSNLHGFSVHGPIDWRKVPSINWRSRIVLSLHREPHRLLYCTLSSRLFEALGSCSFVLGDDPLGQEELFEPNSDLVKVGDKEPPLDLAEFYLNNPEARRKIAENGYRKVMNRDTASHRAEFLIREIFGS